MRSKKPTLIAFSSVQTDYFSRIERLLVEPIRQVYGIREEEYRRLSAGGRYARLRLRLAMYIAYPLKVFWASITARRDTILLVSSNTFYAPLLAWASSRIAKPRIVHWLLDLYPDALEVAGKIRRGGFRSRVVGMIQKASNRNCTYVVYLGEFLRIHGERRWGPARRSAAIDVAADEMNFHQPKMECNSQLTLHYGGQLGHMHDVDSLSACVRAVTNMMLAEVKFDLRISGVHSRLIVESLSMEGVQVSGPIPSEEWRKLIKDFQVGLVSLSPGGATVCLPSKTYAMMAGGLAIIAVCPFWSDLGRLVIDTDSGWVINNSPFSRASELENGNYAVNCEMRRNIADVAAEFSDLVRKLVSNRSMLEVKRHNAIRAARVTFGSEALRRRWARVLHEVSN